MKLLRKLTAFILVFSLLAGTVAAISAAVVTEADTDRMPIDETIAEEIPPLFESGKADLADTAAQSYTPRLTAPAYNNKYYYSDLNVFYKYGWGMPNCTCYAWGRAYEILGRAPELSVYSAYLWYGYNKDHNIYPYGTTPKPGAIACWVYSSGTSGHVAVVEKIEGNTVTFSNSAYSGIEFYTNTAPINDPSDGNKTWIFQGYIYIGDYENPAGSVETPASTVTTPAPEESQTGDVYRITSSDGVNLRKGYGTSYAVLGGIGYGRDVTVTRYKKNEGYTWGLTNYNGVTGWFVTDFAKLIYKKTADTAPTTPAPAATTPVTETTPPANRPVESSAAARALEKYIDTTIRPTEAPTEPPTEAQTEAAKGPAVPERMLMMGDMDGDNELTIMDATRIQLIVAELLVPTEYMLTVGDFDGDSVFNIMDSARIRYHLAFLEA